MGLKRNREIVEQGLALMAIDEGATAGQVPTVQVGGGGVTFETAGGGGGLSVVEVDIAFGDAYWTTADEKVLVELQDGQILFDLWLTVATTFLEGATEAQAAVFATNLARSNFVQLAALSWTFDADEAVTPPMLRVGSPPSPSHAAKSLAAQGAIDGASKAVPIRATGNLFIVMFPDTTYALTQGAGWVNALIYTP